MSDAYLLDRNERERSSGTARRRGAGRLEPALLVVAALLGLLLVAELGWFLVYVPTRPLRSVDIVGAEGMVRQELLAVAGIDGKTTYFSLDAAKAEQSLETLPGIAAASVAKRFPDGVKISVVPRVPLAVALAEVDGRTVPVVFDDEGVVFRMAGNVAAASSGPVISGLRFERPREGMRLPAFLKPLLAQLAELKRDSPALLDALSEIRVVPGAYDTYELVVYPARTGPRVRIGSELNQEVLRYMMLLLDVLASREIETDELDFRTGTATYRAKED